MNAEQTIREFLVMIKDEDRFDGMEFEYWLDDDREVDLLNEIRALVGEPPRFPRWYGRK